MVIKNPNQDKDKDKQVDELALANKELSFQKKT